jgi:hypothetical protein
MINILLCFCFDLFYFDLHHFIKNTKEKILVPLIAYILLLLPFVHYVVP